MAGNYQFSGDSANAVINQGNIVAADGGYVAMIAAKIINTGSITTPKGSTLMGAGSTVTLDLGGPVKLEVNEATLDTYIEQGGAIKADGGFVYLTAKAAGELTTSVINHTGLTQAQSLSTNDKGEIVLLGDMQNGQLNVAGTLDASAPNGGDGGFIETSASNVQIAANTSVTTQAQSGKTGEWLIDPTDFNIDAGGASQTASGIGATTLSSNLDLNNVTLATSATDTGSELGDINVNAAVSWSSDTTLTLNAHNDINIDAPITATGTNAGVALNYGGYIQNSGTVAADTNYHVNAPVTLSGTNASFAVNGQSYTLLHSQADLDAAKDASGNYALGNDVSLTGTYSDSVLGNFSGTLAGLGHTVDGLTILQSDSGFTTPVGFIAKLGAGSTVRDIGLINVDISNNATSSSPGIYSPDFATGGLVGFSDGNYYTHNLLSNNYVTGSVIGSSYVGGLVGYTEYTDIANSYSTADVESQVPSSSYVGGLAGSADEGTHISNSYASGAVRGYYRVGGLVGKLIGSGTISNSYASGDVNGSGDHTGGLLGYFLGLGQGIVDSYALGDVTSSGDNVGGLIGIHYAGNISNSYAAGNVTSSSNGVGGLIGEASLSDDSRLSNSYAFGSVTGASATDIGGLVGRLYSGTVDGSNTYATTDASGVTINTGGNFNSYGNSTSRASVLTLIRNDATWDRAKWTFPGGLNSAGEGYSLTELPYLTNVTAQSERSLFDSGWGTQASPYQITNWAQLQNINYNSDVLTTGYYFELAGSLDGNSAGYLTNWTPLGNATNPFNGYFDGQYHILADLNTAPSMVNAGLFGVTASNATIAKVGLTNARIQGTTNVGGLVGSNAGTISESFVSGAVQGSNFNIGGLAGENTGTIRNSYTSGTVTGIDSGDNVGGLVGYNDITVSGGTITHSYSTAQVAGTNFNSGGLIGYDEDFYATRADNYFATTSSTGTPINDSGSFQGDYAGNFFGEAKTYEQLTQAATFGGWTGISSVGGDGSVWRIYDGNSTPLLRGFLTPLTATATGNTSSQVYNGTTALQSTSSLSWSATPDNSRLLGSGFSLSNKNVGTRSLQSDYYSMQTGYDVILDSSIAQFRINVTPLILTGVNGLSALNKTYDGTTLANIDSSQAQLTGVINGDDVAASTVTGRFADKNAATNKTVTVNTFMLTGADAGNYLINNNTQFNSMNASISRRALSAINGLAAVDKIYDGTDLAQLETDNVVFTGFISGDQLRLSASGRFADKNAAANKQIFIENVALTGLDANNYTINNNTTINTATATINRRVLNGISGINAEDKIYDGTTLAQIDTNNATFSELVSGDQVVLSATGGQFSDANAGGAKRVTIEGLQLAGLDAQNYQLALTQPVTTTATIDRRPITVTANDVSKSTNRPDPALTYITGCGASIAPCGLVSGESLSGSLRRAPGETQGNYAITQGSVNDANNGNYAITFQPGNLTIEGPAGPPRSPRTDIATGLLTSFSAHKEQLARQEAESAFITNVQPGNESIDQANVDNGNGSITIRYLTANDAIPDSVAGSMPLFVIDGGIRMSSPGLRIDNGAN